MDRPEKKELTPQKQNEVAQPPRAVGRLRDDFIEGEFREIQPEKVAPVSATPQGQEGMNAPIDWGRDWVDKLGDQLQRAHDMSPSTSSTLWAAWRQGLKDLQNVVLNPFPDHVAQHEEPGSIAVPTQYEVYQDKHVDAPEPTGHGLPPQAMGTPSRLEAARERAAGTSPDKEKGRSFDIG